MKWNARRCRIFCAFFIIPERLDVSVVIRVKKERDFRLRARLMSFKDSVIKCGKSWLGIIYGTGTHIYIGCGA